MATGVFLLWSPVASPTLFSGYFFLFGGDRYTKFFLFVYGGGREGRRDRGCYSRDERGVVDVAVFHAADEICWGRTYFG